MGVRKVSKLASFVCYGLGWFATFSVIVVTALVYFAYAVYLGFAVPAVLVTFSVVPAIGLIRLMYYIPGYREPEEFHSSLFAFIVLFLVWGISMMFQFVMLDFISYGLGR